MAFDPLTALFEVGSRVIERLFPDPVKAEEAKLKLVEMQQNGELAKLASATELAKGQIEINKVEAQSTNWFIAGWRPAIGWVGAISLFVYYVPYCLTATVIWAYQVIHTGQLVARPDLGITDLIGLIASMLGVAGMRTFEKWTGVERNR